MTEGRLVFLLLSALLLHHTGFNHAMQVQAIKCDYVLLGAYTLNTAIEFNFSLTARYLEATAGVALAARIPHCNGKVAFRFEMHEKNHSNNWDLRRKMVDGSVDFMLTHPHLQLCSSCVGAIPVLSYSRVLDPRVPRAKGMLLIWGGMREKIRGYQDLADKAIGIPVWPSMILFSRHAQEMAKFKLHSWQDPAKVFIYGTKNGSVFMFEELVNGHIDAAFWSTDLLSLIPARLAPSILSVCNGTYKPVAEGMSCTEERVDNPLLAMKHTPAIVTQAVVQAILNMPGGANHAANKQSKVTAWLPPDDYLSNVKMWLEWGGLLEEIAPGERWCSNDLVKSITCPAGYIKKPNNWILNGCDNMGKECRAPRSLQQGNTGCICKPCALKSVITLHPRANLSVACTHLKECLSVVQFSDAFLSLKVFGSGVDEDHSDTVSYTVSQKGSRVLHGAGVIRQDDDLCHETSDLSDCPHLYQISLPTSTTGHFLVHVVHDGNAVPGSPVWYSVTPVECPTVMEGPNKNGTCVCISSAIRVNGVCQSAVVIFAYVMAPLLALTAAYIFFHFEKKSAGLVNQIDGNQIMVDDNAKIIGMGGDGVVVQVMYRNTKVAIKAAGIYLEQNTLTNAAELISLLRVQTQADSASLSGLRGCLSRVINRKGGKSSQDTSQPVARSVHPRNGTAGGSNTNVAHITAAQAAHDHKRSKRGLSVAGLTNTIQLRRQKRHLIKEIRALSKIRHPCITTIMGVVNLHSSTPLLVLEYMEGGNLFDFLHTKPVDINAHTIVRILQDVCYGLEFLHTAKPSICHGDIKSRNILLNASQSQAKIADFGLVQTKASKKPVGGTVTYMAPELLTNMGSVTVYSDVYALGILINECLTRQVPYGGMHLSEEVLFRIVKGQLRPALPTDDSYAMIACVLVSQCWNGDLRLRPDVHNVMSVLQQILPSLKDVVIPAPAALMRVEPLGRMEREETSDIWPKTWPEESSVFDSSDRDVQPAVTMIQEEAINTSWS